MLFRSKEHADTFARLPTGLFVFCAFALGMFIATLIHTQSPGRQTAPPPFATESTPDPEIALFELKGVIYTPATLPDDARKAFHEAWRGALTQYQHGMLQAAEMTVKQRAGEFSDVISGSGAAAVSDEDVERFYNDNAAQMTAPLEAIRDELKRALQANRKAEASGALIKTLVQSGQLTFAGQLTGER